MCNGNHKVLLMVLEVGSVNDSFSDKGLKEKCMERIFVIKNKLN